jgi:WhiB family redox-sensing transcriptional regulator
MDAPDWDLALCARTRPPMRGWWTSDDRAEREAARLACFSCPIRRACADWAVRTLTIDNHRPDLAIWGGMHKAERARRRRDWLASQRELRWRAEAG